MTSTAPLRLLAIASRPSDFVEMADLARVLAERQHHVSLLYLYSREDPSCDAVLAQLATLAQESGVAAGGVEVSELPASFAPVAVSTDATTSSSASSSPVAARSIDAAPSEGATDALRAAVRWAQRHGLNVYPKNTVIGRAAYTAMHVTDALRDRPRMAMARVLRAKLKTRLGELPWRLRLESTVRVYQGASMVLHYQRFAAFFRNTIDALSLDALLIPEDIVGNIWPVAIKAGHDAGIPTLVLPYTLANQEEAIQSLKGVSVYQTSENTVAATLFPRWRYRSGAIDIVRLPSAHVFAHEELGITPPDPWMMNSGLSDRILVDSQASRQYFLDGGIPDEQIAVIGSASQDRMFALRQNRDAGLAELRQELGLQGEKPLLLISGCPDQLSAPVPYCEFANMQALAAFVGESVAPLLASYHVVVRPHPNYLEFGSMLAPYGVVTTMRPTSSVVPLADVFMAFASATIRWAIACAIPAVNYDVFHYEYRDFATAKGVRTVTGGADFKALIGSLTPGSPTLHQLVDAAKAESEYWSLMDGRSVTRLEDQIHLARQRRAQTAKEPQQHA